MGALIIECPKCSGRAWIDRTVSDIGIKCLCGYYKVIERTTKEGIRTHTSLPECEVRLPRLGTKLSICLHALLAETETDTQSLAERLGQNSSDTASQLTILLGKGLVYRTLERRGVAGGSRWRLTSAANNIMGVN